MKSSNVFERVEKKYLIDQNKFNLLFQYIKPYMTVDKFGLHTICNIYYDTDDYELIRNSIEKPKYKEKLRLRSYGVPKDNDNVFLEIKKKYDGTVFKRRINLSLKEAVDYLDYGIKPNRDSQILNEIDYFINFHKPTKKVLIAYERLALFSNDDADFRITFDHNIRSRTYDLYLNKGDYGTPTLNSDSYLVEIKTSSSIPLWLVENMSKLKIYPSSFSKYGTVYKQNLINSTDYKNESYKQIIINEEKLSENIYEFWRNENCLQVH